MARGIGPRRLACCMALVATVGAACSNRDAISTGEPTSIDAASAHWEAVLLADSATSLEGEGHEIVRLDGVGETLTVFSDRPERLSGELGLLEFLTFWHAGVFRDDPPNAAVVAGEDVRTVELTGAVWDPSGDSLWLSVDPLQPVADGGDTESDEAGKERSMPTDGPVQVFIDAFTTPVNPQVTDAVTQTNVKVVSEVPAQAMGLVYQAMAQSVGLAEQNATQAQASLNQVGNAVTDQAVARILSQS